MPTMKDMVVMLICDDVQESIEFYTNVLGFSVVNRMDTVGKTGWASLSNGGVQLMLASPDSRVDATGGVHRFYHIVFLRRRISWPNQ